MSCEFLSFYQETTELQKVYGTIEFLREQYMINLGEPISENEFFSKLGVKKDELINLEKLNALLTKSGLREKIFPK